MDKRQHEVNYVCSELNRRIKQMTYNEETCIREFLETCDYDASDNIQITEEECDYISSVLNVNENCIHDCIDESVGVYKYEEEIDEDDEAFWKAQDRADDLNDERRIGL